MVWDVTTYAGELDDDPGKIIHRLPGAWVTFGGIVKTERYSTSRQKRKVTGRFVVVVGDYNTRDEQSARHGGVNQDEVGTNLLVESVRRLITGQDLGLKIDYFEPGRVRTLFNTAVEERALSVFSCEFDTAWIERALENGKWPERSADPEAPDAAFNAYDGELSDPDPDLLRVGIRYHQPGTSQDDDQEDLVEVRKEENGND
ncbi:phage protein Gp37 [Trabulsiella odontotermitis]|uniref:phage protein Gp37 n=1 Tax=Trabulsiella odontotermitis TaxID=379893 RepID=UPI000675E678|nr:phage protein Gp37 [Trabulsiella odontotermitis]